jgi:hypothetical protein
MARPQTPAAIIIFIDLFQRLTDFFNSVTPPIEPNVIQSHATRITIFNLHHQIQMQLDRASIPYRDYHSRITQAQEGLMQAIHKAYNTSDEAHPLSDQVIYA